MKHLIWVAIIFYSCAILLGIDTAFRGLSQISPGYSEKLDLCQLRSEPRLTGTAFVCSGLRLLFQNCSEGFSFWFDCRGAVMAVGVVEGFGSQPSEFYRSY